jgi:hypothetical protein
VRGEEIERGSKDLDSSDPTQASPDVLQPSVRKRSSQRYQQQRRVSQMRVQIGDRVKVVDQDITGVVVEMGWGNKVVITDDASEYEAPDNRLEFRDYELEVTK